MRECSMCLVQDVCVKKDFDDLYSKMTEDGARELQVIHGGVVELSYQPLSTARDLTSTVHPFSTEQAPAPPATDEPAAAEQDAEAAPAALEDEPTQVHGKFLVPWMSQLKYACLIVILTNERSK